MVLAATAPAWAQIVLRDVGASTGIAFRHTDGSSGRRYIVETVASGMATFDFDADGRIDVYFLNGRPLRGAPSGPQPKNALYRNLGGWKFEEVTKRAGVGDAGYGMGVAVGDYDNDGLRDLYVNNFGPNVLYRNLGGGRFADVTAAARVDRPATVGAGTNFLDIDGDGQLDLFVANYVRFTYENHVVWSERGHPRYSGPKDYPHQPANLFRNLGNGTFQDVRDASGIGSHAGPGMGSVCLDFDDDGDTDIFVCNDNTGNFLFENDGAGRFREIALSAGVAYNGYGDAMSSMGADCGDYDHDGRLDLFQTSYHQEQPALFRNLGAGSFEDVTLLSGIGAYAMSNVKWGCALADFDNDGHLDIFIARGHLDDNIHLFDDSVGFAARPVLLRSTGDGKFVDVSDSAGDGMRVKLVARGAAFDDLDNDGQIDAVLLGSRGPPLVLRNQSNTENHWLDVELRGVKANRDGVGARVRVVAGDLVQTAEVHSGRGYQSHFGSRLHFGLGKHRRVDRIEVRWIGGGTDVFEQIAADARVALTEGSGGHPAADGSGDESP